MVTFIFGLLAVVLYGLGTLHQTLVYLRKRNASPLLSFSLGITAATCHGIATACAMRAPDGLDISLTNSLSLTSILVVLSLLLLSTRRPLQNLLQLVYPLTAASVVAMLLINHGEHQYTPDHAGIYAHILLSILAYSASSIAAAQGALILLQNHNLKRRHSTILSRNLPPLLTMEKLLFEILRLAATLLLLSVLTGVLFIEDFLAQKLAHKTAFTAIALIMFTVILCGRHRYGWRGTSVSVWTIAGCTMLMLGYFGSKFVLEWILQQAPAG
jgi:ABC-type uncharacterized transport system permease subunit